MARSPWVGVAAVTPIAAVTACANAQADVFYGALGQQIILPQCNACANQTLTNPSAIMLVILQSGEVL